MTQSLHRQSMQGKMLSTKAASSSEVMAYPVIWRPHWTHLYASLLIVMLSGCATPIPPPPQIVNVPVPVSCLPAVLPQRPKTATDTELAALDDYKFPLAIFLDRRLLLDYSAELEAVLLACR